MSLSREGIVNVRSSCGVCRFVACRSSERMLYFILTLLCLSSAIEARRLISLKGIFDRGPVRQPGPLPVRGCRLPGFPENGGYIALNRPQKSPGELAGRYTVLKYSCNNDFDLTAPTSECTLANTWSTTPECSKRCDMVSSPTVNFECFSSLGAAIPCSAKLRNGTNILSSCKNRHCTLKQNLARLTCRNGNWDEKTPECEACTTDAGVCDLCSRLTTPHRETSTQPSVSTGEAVHQAKLSELVEQNVILGNSLKEYNSSVQEQLGSISGRQANMTQMHLVQEAKINEGKAILKKQMEDISQLRSELQSLKTASIKDDVVKHNEEVLKLLRRELDLLKAAQQAEVAKPSANMNEAVHQAKLSELIEQNMILGKSLKEYNTSMREHLSSISGRQTNMTQMHLVQETKINEGTAILKKQMEEISQLRSELESLKTTPMKDGVVKRNEEVLKLLRRELDLLKAVQQAEVAKPASINETVHQAKLAELVEQNVILGNSLKEYNSSVREQISSISGRQTNMTQMHLVQETKLNEGTAILKKQKEEISQLRSELESLKTAPMKDSVVKRNEEVLKLLKGELDLLKAAQQVEVAKQKQENSKLRAEVESLKTSLMQEVAKQKADNLQLMDGEIVLLQSVPVA